MTETQDPLLPCPMCGNRAYLQFWGQDDAARAACLDGECGVMLAAPTKQIARERWNSRAALRTPEAPAPVALREVGLSRDVHGTCIVTINGREAIRDSGFLISQFAKPPADVLTDKQIAEIMLGSFPKTKCSQAYLAFARAIESAVREQR